MADRLHLSYWLRGFTEFNMLRHFGTLLRVFPWSRLQPGALLRVHAVSLREPAILEQEFADPLDLEELLAAARHHRAPDIAVQVEARWDIWQLLGEWKLAPSIVSLYAFAPQFEREQDEQMRIDFGPDFHFLPQPEEPGSPRFVQSNIRSLLSLVHGLDNGLSAERRQLWSESGENFAARLQSALQELA